MPILQECIAWNGARLIQGRMVYPPHEIVFKRLKDSLWISARLSTLFHRYILCMSTTTWGSESTSGVFAIPTCHTRRDGHDSASIIRIPAKAENWRQIIQSHRPRGIKGWPALKMNCSFLGSVKLADKLAISWSPFLAICVGFEGCRNVHTSLEMINLFDLLLRGGVPCFKFELCCSCPWHYTSRATAFIYPCGHEGSHRSTLVPCLTDRWRVFSCLQCIGPQATLFHERLNAILAD